MRPLCVVCAQVPGRWRTIKAHGRAVGLPSDDDMGNSEVGAVCWVLCSWVLGSWVPGY